MGCSRAAVAADVSALSWLDTLGFAGCEESSIRAGRHGFSIRVGNQRPGGRTHRGTLVREEADAFHGPVPDFGDGLWTSPAAEPLTTRSSSSRGERATCQRVELEALDFEHVSSAALDRVRDEAAKPDGLRWGSPNCASGADLRPGPGLLAKRSTGRGAVLMEFAANIPDFWTGKIPVLREALQRDIGDAVLEQAEKDSLYPKIPWTELLKVYEHFDTRFPASPKIAYAQETAAVLRKMIAEEAAHHPKPLEKMTPTEQVAENIYQLRNLERVMWIMNSKYPLDAYDAEKKKEVITPVHRLVDLGNVAVPPLIEALDDRRFTRCVVDDFHGGPPKVMRVSDVAQRILEHMSGRNFWQKRAEGGKSAGPTTREQAVAWWAEVQGKGEKPTLIEAAGKGDQAGCEAARKLVEKYPDAALAAIKAGIKASTHNGYRGEFVEIAGTLPGEASLDFLKSQLDSSNGLYSQVYAAKELSRRGERGAVPAMIEAWRKIQPRLPTDEGDAYSEVGGVIGFLATSGDVRAIEALGQDIRKAPVDVRLAVVEVFLPFPKRGGGGGLGKSVNVYADPNDYMVALPAGEAGAAIERLLAAALDDTERRVGREGDYNEFSYADPRICDMAALVLAQRWPKKYQFQWIGTIDRLRCPDCASAQPVALGK